MTKRNKKETDSSPPPGPDLNDHGGLPAQVETSAPAGNRNAPDRPPTAFTVHGRRYRVAGKGDFWPGRRFEHFKVRTESGDHFLLHHDLESDQWLAEWLDRTDA